MRVVHAKIEGPWEVSDTVALHGMATGPVEVVAGGVLQLYGMATDTITVSGGKLSVFGTASRVVAREGTVRIDGVVEELDVSAGVALAVDREAVIRKGAHVTG